MLGRCVGRIDRARISLGVVAVAVLACSSTGSARPFTYVGRVGFHVHLEGGSLAAAEQGMRTLKAARVTWVRADLDWRYVEPRRNSFDWSRGDTLMTAAAKTRTNVLAILAYAPRWAQRNGSAPYAPPTDLSDYVTYVKYVMWRYGPGGDFWRAHRELKPMPLRAVELWNEPWSWWYWRPDPDPAEYARLARAGAAAIRSIAPRTTILLSGDVWQFRRDDSDPPWLAVVLKAEPRLRNLVSGYSVHAYSGAFPPGSTRAQPRFAFSRIALTTRVARRLHAAKPVWVTEYGWSTAPATTQAVSERQQARYLVQATKLALHRYHVAKAFVYDYARSSGARGDLDDNYGMMRADGTYKPAWFALTRLLRQR